MTRSHVFNLITILISVIICSSCAQNVYEVAYPTLFDQKYDSEFPYRNCSDELERVVETVKKLNCTVYYEAFDFAADSQVTLADLDDIDVKDMAESRYFFNSSVNGTATVIYFYDRYLALLTCAHTVEFSDTLIIYRKDDSGESDYIHTLAIKQRQSNFIRGFDGNLDVLAADRQLDVAILGTRLLGTSDRQIPYFDYPLGEAKALEWGSFVYLVGYPLGFQMITKGIVSSPNRDKKGAFLVDALFNEGLSGGIVLAVRDGVPNFELVGMAKAVSANFEKVVIPEDHYEISSYDPQVPYTGPVFVKTRQEINYGITHVVSIEEIQAFIEKNHDEISKKGFDLSHLF